MDGKIYFSQDGIRVTKKEFIVKGEIYPIDKIDSISFRELEPRRWLSLLCLMAGLILLLQEDRLFAVGGLLLTVGLLLSICAKQKFAIVLRLPQGEKKALVGDDSEYLEQIIKALNAAIGSRTESKVILSSDLDDASDYPSRIPPSLE